jgi:hypothetical protein
MALACDHTARQRSCHSQLHVTVAARGYCVSVGDATFADREPSLQDRAPMHRPHPTRPCPRRRSLRARCPRPPGPSRGPRRRLRHVRRRRRAPTSAHRMGRRPTDRTPRSGRHAAVCGWSWHGRRTTELRGVTQSARRPWTGSPLASRKGSPEAHSFSVERVRLMRIRLIAGDYHRRLPSLNCGLT